MRIGHGNVFTWKRNLALFSLLATIGCGESDSTGSGEGTNPTSLTIKLEAAETSAALRLGKSLTAKFAEKTLTGAGNLSFTPVSYKLWISTIVLQGEDGLSNQFYICDTSEEDCELDFADPESVDAFEEKLSAIPVGSGTYTKVWLSCSPDEDGYMKFKGSVTLEDDTVIYTANKDSNGGVPWTTDIAKYDTLKVGGLGGGCGLTMPLAKPLFIPEPAAPEEEVDETVEAAEVGETVTMTLFSNLKLAAYYAPMTSSGMGGCETEAAAESQGPGFCGTYPSVFPYFGETTPTVEYYRVANHVSSASTLTEDDVNVLVKVILGSDGVPFWASFGNIFKESTPSYGSGDKGVSGYANAVGTFSINADESLVIKSMDYGFSAFERGAHTGEVKGEGLSNGAGTGSAVTYYYSAYPYLPE